MSEDGTKIIAKYKRSDVDQFVKTGQRIAFRYKNTESVGRIIKTDFNKNFEMAYGVVTIEEQHITFTTGIEKIDILELDKNSDEL